MTYLQLYWSFFKVGLFSFGGGMAAIPVIQSEVVDAHGWLTLTEFIDLVTIAEMLPGPVAITSATFVGIQVSDYLGALIAVAGCITPSCIIVTLLAWAYSKYKNLYIMQGLLSGLRLAIVALIASAGMTILELAVLGEGGIVWNTDFTIMGKDGAIWNSELISVDVLAVIIVVIALTVLRKCKRVKPIQVMIGSGVIGGMLYIAMTMM